MTAEYITAPTADSIKVHHVAFSEHGHRDLDRKREKVNSYTDDKHFDALLARGWQAQCQTELKQMSG